MKKTLLTMIAVLGSSVANATDWANLINIAPTLQTENIAFDTKKQVTADVVKIPSGQYRLVSFTSFAANKKIIVSVDAPSYTVVGELCRDSVHFNKPFKAQLIITTNPLVTNDKPLMAAPTLDIFENRPVFSPAKVTFEKKTIGWTQMDYDSMAQAKGRQLVDYYADLINAQLQQAGDNIMVMDLSKLNAFACDLMTDRMEFRVTREVEYEAGLPKKQNWLGLDQFADIFHGFWRMQPRVVSPSLSVTQNSLAEAVALGIAAAPKVTADELSSPARIQKLLAAVKAEVRGATTEQKPLMKSTDISDNWSMNTEFAQPASPVKQEMTIISGPVYVDFKE